MIAINWKAASDKGTYMAVSAAINAIAQQAAQRSVTRYDAFSRIPSYRDGPISVILPTARSNGVNELPIDLPQRWSRRRDMILASTTDHNDMWASAVGRAVTKQVARGWEVEDAGESERRVRQAQVVIQSANKGRGFAHFLGQHLQDFLLTDNGAFTEVVWSTPFVYRDTAGRLRPLGRVLSIQHLDSMRCTNLIDDDILPFAESICRRYPLLRPDEVNAQLFPVAYMDYAGRTHLLWRWQVFHLADMPSPRYEHRRTGLSSASRAYRTIHTSTGLERYIDEKITGERVLEIHLVNGINRTQFQEALEGAAEQQRARGLREFRGVVVVPATKMDANLSGYRIPIAEVPDGFDAATERTEARIKIANALGIPVRDLEPAPAGLNSGATALLEAERADGTGLAGWSVAFRNAINECVVSEYVTWRWQENTVRDKRAEAEVQQLRASTRDKQIKSGEITTDEARQLAVDAGDLPREFLPDDATPQDELSDDEKPEEETEQEPAGATGTDAASEDTDPDGSTQEIGAQPAFRLNRKASDDDTISAEIDATFNDARAWAVEAVTKGRRE
jgi:hypothetical protein